MQQMGLGGGINFSFLLGSGTSPREMLCLNYLAQGTDYCLPPCSELRCSAARTHTLSDSAGRIMGFFSFSEREYEVERLQVADCRLQVAGRVIREETMVF